MAARSANVNYYAYIRSPEWRAKADAAKRRAGYRCQVCNRPSSQVVLNAHHRTYERLGNELPEDITVLCEDCHKLYEKNKRVHAPPAAARARAESKPAPAAHAFAANAAAATLTKAQKRRARAKRATLAELLRVAVALAVLWFLGRSIGMFGRPSAPIPDNAQTGTVQVAQPAAIALPERNLAPIEPITAGIEQAHAARVQPAEPASIELEVASSEHSDARQPAAQPQSLTVLCTVERGANIRSGPGTQYKVIGGAAAGEVVAANGHNDRCDPDTGLWYRLTGGRWMADLVIDCPESDGLAFVDVDCAPVNSPTAPPPTALPPTIIPPTAVPAEVPTVEQRAAPVIDTNCDPSYPTVCIPPAPPDLDCGQIPYRRFEVRGADPHRFDGDHDGIGCESG